MGGNYIVQTGGGAFSFEDVCKHVFLRWFRASGVVSYFYITSRPILDMA